MSKVWTDGYNNMVISKKVMDDLRCILVYAEDSDDGEVMFGELLKEIRHVRKRIKASQKREKNWRDKL